MNSKKFSKFDLQLQGKKVSYLQFGKGPTILFLHGLGIGTDIWKQVILNMNNKYTIVLLDLPGYGLNKKFLITPKFDSLTKFINDFIEKKGSVGYLVGYSLSGTFSHRIAQNPPSSLKKIILISTPVFYSHFIVLLNWIFRTIGFHPLITKIFKFFISRFPIKHLIFFLGGLSSIKNPKAMNDCMNKFGEKSDQSYIFTSASIIFSPTQFASISVPIEFIYGKRDGFATSLMAKKMQRYCKKSVLHIVKDVYHLMPLEKPQELARLIEISCSFNKKNI
ncbi:MAG: dihydrolipoyllysine-residue acetyltransferase component of acetoincleaving system [uncultured bacterium]|nr:MAG: dihydrolipoyllysine-residue acetyltransferase component of acetoincleaving system [uncultured bacterium]